MIVSIAAIGQPRIDNVDRIAGYPFNTVQITGVGFSANPADLQVWFGSVRGVILTSSESLITATVPASARVSHVEVINVTTRRSAKSNKKFTPVFSGVQPFTNNFTVTSSTNVDDIFELCSCDFDGDGKPDIAGSKFKDGKSNIMMLRNTSTIAANNTTMSFAQSTIAISFPTFSVNCGDINGDGKPDLVASRGGTSTGNSIFVFQNTSAAIGSITFAAPVQLDITLGAFAKQIAIRDLNRDGRPELVVTNDKSNNIYIFENKLTSTTIVANQFTRVDKVVTGAVSADGTLALETADLTGDGWPEIIVSPNANATKVFILENSADGSLSFPTVRNTPISGGANINDISIADFDRDGALDFVVADRGASGGKAFVYLNRGIAFTSVNSSTGFAALVAWGVDVADMNGDGFVDFVVSQRKLSAPEEINIFISDGAATPNFTKSTITTPKANWFSLTQDFDGDSKPDIAATATNNGTQFSIDVWKNRNCHQAVILNENPLTICSPQVVALKAVPLQGVTFTWSTGDSGPTSNVDVTDVGTVTLTAVGDGGGCTTQTTITINNGGGSVPPTPTITAPTGVCSGNSLTLSTATVADSYEWSGPNNYTSTAQNPPAITNMSVTTEGLYRLRVKTGGCFSDYTEKQIDVIVPDAFSITSSVGSAGVCSGQPVTLSVTSVSGYDYQWKKNGTNVGTNSPTFPIAAVAESDQDGYTVFVSHQTITCTDETSPYALNVLTAPVASFTRTPTLVCVGTQVTFNAAGSTVDNTATTVYTWTFGDASNGTGVSATHTYASPLTNVSASLTISYSGVTGCSNVSTPASFNVSSATAPTITVDPVATEICPDGSETIALSVVGTFSTFAWSTGGTSASIQVTTPDTYSVITTDANGCTGNAETILTEKPGCTGGAPTIPKVFTPNGDLANDLWVITSIPNVQEFQMNVFDGRGRRIFESKNFPVTGWDGIANGKPVPDGTYYYVLACPSSKPVTGSVLIVR